MQSNHRRVIVPTYHTIELIDPKDILYINIVNGKTVIHLLNAQLIITQKAITTFELKLQGLGFLTIHRSIIINTAYIERIIRPYNVELKGKVVLPVSRRKKQNLYNNIIQMEEQRI